MLKKKIGDKQEVMPTLPLVSRDEQTQIVPEAVLKHDNDEK